MTSAPRYISLDLCRGVAVLGILLLNITAYAQPFQVYENPTLSPVPLSEADIALWWGISTFASEKFYTILAMLFGIGFTLCAGMSAGPEDQARREETATGPVFKTALFRRQLWLIIIGLIHGLLIWDGDILVLYGVIGFLMWNWRHASGPRLLMFGGLLYLLGSALILWMIWLSVPADSSNDTRAVATRILDIRSSFAGSLSATALSFLELLVGQINVFGLKTLGLMMLGLGLYKTGFLKGTASFATYLAFTALAATSLGLIGWQNVQNINDGFLYPDLYTKGQVHNELLSLLVSLGYVSVLILILRAEWVRVLLYPVIACGRMSLSVYLMQSVMMTAIFYGGRGFGIEGLPLYGKFNISDLVPIVLSVWVFQMLFCSLWLKICRYGPMEWLWRSLSQGESVPLFKRVDMRV